MARQAKSVPAGTIPVAAASEPAVGTRRDRKRDAIIAVAKDLFFTQGYERTSMNDIVARVGGSKATLYSHFDSKDDLLLAVVEDVVMPRTAEVLAIPDVPSFRAYLEWLAPLAIRRLTTHEILSLHRLAASEALRFPEVGRVFYEQAIRPGHVLMADVFQRAMDEGVLRQGDPVKAVEEFLELCTGWLLRCMIWNIRSAPSEVEIEEKSQLAIAIFMDGYAERKPPRKSARK